MPSNITAPRVPFLDSNGNVSREWYRFFFSLFELTGGGQNVISLTDLQVGPPSDDMLVALVTELAKAVQAARVAPQFSPDAVLTKAVQGLQEMPPPLDTLALSKAVQGLQVVPPSLPATTPMTATATLDFPNTAAGACSDLTITVPGAVSGDVVTLGVPNGSVPANGGYFAWVSAADTVTVRYFNNDLVSAYNPASGTFRVAVARF